MNHGGGAMKRLEPRNSWGDGEGQGNAGSPSSGGASPYPEPSHFTRSSAIQSLASITVLFNVF